MSSPYRCHQPNVPRRQLCRNHGYGSATITTTSEQGIVRYNLLYPEQLIAEDSNYRERFYSYKN